MESFDTISRYISFSGLLEVKTSLHIGAGKTTDSLGSDMPVIRDFQNNPFIPGSSFKGVIRSFCESMLRSFSPGDKTFCCDISSKNWCVTNTDKTKFWNNKNSNEPNDHEAWYKYLDEKLCPICKIFGSPWQQGKVHFPDMSVKLDSWNSSMFTIRDCTAIDRESGIAKDKSKYDFEIIPSGVQFQFSMSASNLEDWELGLLLFALESFDNDFVTLGGLKSKGAGHIKINILKINPLNPYCLSTQEKTIIDTTEAIKNFKEKTKIELDKKIKDLQKKARGSNYA